ncbi:hypothetical protein BO86DRAFT_435689 [Aspergillus japonicus CBS 114.51]|uniref:Uncharacterized protein n=1 Tax=Aspergillus japonicus CBS 114.51 TaxID=1448312 RepID=A0A8T8WVE3_ASPJA|nr:hypothetical protein BO86DRAFT_435689 [Aspergillus japonicus CBS 114.51]RAH79624.1 hypothetical protein BO86DRAFT_435689 [Aspergillus japonicus CBS 114.51]
MAHLVDRICWDVLTSNLVFQSHPTADVDEATNLYFRFRPQQGQEIGRFADSLAHAIARETERERGKYPARYDPPQRDDLILADEMAQKIQPLAYTWCHNACWGFDWKVTTSPEPCRHVESEGFACGCPLPYRERLGSAFLRQYHDNDCFRFFQVNGDAFFNLQVVNALLVLGEMDPVLQLCAHPAIELGWDKVFEVTLDFYLLLNLLYDFPELREGSQTGLDDYRDTKMYQKTLFLWTQMHSQAEVPSQFHRRFFGLEDHLEAPFTIERHFHLPTKYNRPRASLPVPNEPLHVGNRTVLEEYLDECFRIMVRCNMLAQELGMEIHWPSRVVHALDRLVSSPAGQRLFVTSHSRTILTGENGEFPWSTPE